MGHAIEHPPARISPDQDAPLQREAAAFQRAFEAWLAEQGATGKCTCWDWEQMIAAGGGPCLALGAERRLRRGPQTK